jgi:hypothetical protein
VPQYFFSPSAQQTGVPPACTQAGFNGFFIDVSYYVADSSGAGSINRAWLREIMSGAGGTTLSLLLLRREATGASMTRQLGLVSKRRDISAQPDILNLSD